MKNKGYFPQEFRSMFAAVKNNCRNKQDEINRLKQKQSQIDNMLESITKEIVKSN